jgi:F-box and WD-40 domain protein CDC4
VDTRTKVNSFENSHSAALLTIYHLLSVYSLALDPTFTRAYSGSKDNTIRVWNLQTGQCQHTLIGHTSIIIHIGLSPPYLVSASLDATIRFWDIDTSELRYTLPAHASSITCFQHDEIKMVSGSSEVLKLWSIRRGRMVRDLLIGTTNMWRIAFEGRWCAAASTRDGKTMLDIWNFSHDPDWLIDPSEGTED